MESGRFNEHCAISASLCRSTAIPTRHSVFGVDDARGLRVFAVPPAGLFPGAVPAHSAWINRHNKRGAPAWVAPLPIAPDGPGGSAAHRPGERLIVYKLDYGLYVDLVNTDKFPSGLLLEESLGGDVDFDVPLDDARSYRRAILDLDRFYASHPEVTRTDR